MNKIFIYWFKLKDGTANFGDEIGPFIVSKLSGAKIIFFNPQKKYLRKKIIESIFKKDSEYSLADLLKILVGKKRVLITAGSILSHFNINSCDIWGSGIIKKDEKIRNVKFYALRGKYSQIRLNELNYDVPKATGDPALLLPLLLSNKNTKKKYKLGIIPHYVHYENIKKKYNTDDILIINLLDSNIESVIQKINSCEYTISSSLHGIIVSHAYNIKSLWYNLDEKQLYGDDIKFDDYFSSVGIHNYKPFVMPEINKGDNIVELLINKINSETGINSIQYNMKAIQKKLLLAAPFPVSEAFFNKFNW